MPFYINCLASRRPQSASDVTSARASKGTVTAVRGTIEQICIFAYTIKSRPCDNQRSLVTACHAAAAVKRGAGHVFHGALREHGGT